MPDHDRLSSLILEHWSRYHHSMLEEMRRQDRLQQELETTAEQFADLMYELVSVRKLEYLQAWELAMNEILQPESSSTSLNNHPEISESPMTTASGWAARMKRPKATSKPSGS
jgi:hypothetical protein